MAQIIDEDAHVASGLAEYLDSIGITKSGLGYHIVSIIGAQSSGKSTLLNHVFGTTFQTMNETTGRQQTTKGIHAAYSDKLLVFDIEGSDSRERGDADSLFERKAALFALAMSEVVMVNMWQNDIGRYNASSIPLLKTVFEVNLQLFVSNTDTKCHLLFVIRDSTNDVTVIESQVRRDLDMIWSQLTLPSHLAGRPFEDFFVFHFFPLPHFRLMRPEFDKSVKELSREFRDETCDAYLFHDKTGKVIPGDGLYQYIVNVWEAITENKELNLPSQRRTLSSYRCEEFAQEALKLFETFVNEKIRDSIGTIQNFGNECNNAITAALQVYDEKSAKYVPDIVAEKRQSAIAKMGDALFPYFVEFCKHAQQIQEDEFTRELEVPADFMTETDWLKRIEKIKSHVLDEVERSIRDARVTEYELEWEYDVSELEPELDARIQKRLAVLIKNLEDSVYQSRNVSYKDDIEATFKKGEPDMWTVLRARMKEEIEDCTREVQSRLEVNASGAEPTGNLATKIHQFTAGRALVASQYLQKRMIDKFDSIFLRDESGNARRWTSNEDISELYEQAREEGLRIMKMFSACQLREPGELIPPDDPLTKRLVSPVHLQAWEQGYYNDIEKKYIEAVRIRESNRIHMNIPWWLWALFVIFGYDKIFKAIRHPFQALFVLSILGVIWFLYSRHYMDKYIKEVARVISHYVSLVLVKVFGKAEKPKKRRGKRKVTFAKEVPEPVEDVAAAGHKKKRTKRKAKKSRPSLVGNTTLKHTDMERFKFNLDD